MNSIFKSRDNVQKYVIGFQLLATGYALNTLTFTPSVLLMAFLWFFFMLHVGHNAGLHRYFSHSSFKLTKFWHIFLTFTSTFVAFGSPLGYAVIHKTHHRYSDTLHDPHQPSKPINTFFFNFDTSNDKVSPIYARGLKDYWINFTHRYYLLLITVFYLILWYINPVLALTYNIGIVGILIGTGWVNIIGHKNNPIAYRNHNTRDNSNNDLISGYIFGEWHNNHHSNPTNYTQQSKWWELDIPKYFIRAVKID